MLKQKWYIEMKVNKMRKLSGLPHMVIKQDGTKKRFSDVNEAWRYIIVSGGQLQFGFRAEPKGV